MQRIANKTRYPIPPNKNTRLPTWMFIFDVESTLIPLSETSTQHTFKLAVGCLLRYRHDRKKFTEIYTTFTSPESLADYVDSHTPRNNTLYICSHNISYDLGVSHLLELLQAREWKIERLFLRQGSTVIKLKKEKRGIILFSTTNIWRCSLDKLGKLLNSPKLPLPPQDAPLDVWETYCQQDVRILVEILKKYICWLRDENLGGFCVTIGAQALRTYRHRFMPREIIIDHNPDVIHIEREAYHGGRIKVHQVGELPPGMYYYVDVNSAYPCIMRNEKLPCRLTRTEFNLSTVSLNYLLEKYAVVAQVIVTPNKPVYPVKYAGHIIYPVGRFVTTLTTPELRLAVERGWLERVIVARCYEQDYLFTDFVDYFYVRKTEAKQSGDAVSAEFYKMMLNSLSGKFGSKSVEFREIPATEEYAPGINIIINAVSGRVTRVRRFGLSLFVPEEEGETTYSFPAIIAHITAYQRIKMFHLVEIAGEDNVFLESTDSLIVNEKGYQNLLPYIHPTQLGYLSLQATTSQVTIFGPNDFIFGDTVKLKGVKKSAVIVDENTFTQEHFPSILGLTHTPPFSPYITTRTTKHLRRIIYDGKVTPDGRITPLRIEELNPDKLYK